MVFNLKTLGKQRRKRLVLLPPVSTSSQHHGDSDEDVHSVHVNAHTPAE